MTLKATWIPFEAGLRFLLLTLCLLSFNTQADEAETRRILVGLKLFPAVVAADFLITEKKNSHGKLSLIILYQHDQKIAIDLADKLRQIKQIKDIPVQVSTLTFSDFLQQKMPAGSAAFFAEQPNSNIHAIIKQSISTSILLFSPFTGDVERGVHSGFIVSDRILPYVNTGTLKQSGISLKPFFLRVSKQYE